MTSAPSSSKVTPRPRSREKTRDALQLAMLRVKNQGRRMTISAVAVEAGLTAPLIHNSYPDIAEEIRAAAGKATRKRRAETEAALAAARHDLQEAKKKLKAAQKDIQVLASMNATLREECANLKAKASSNVAVLPLRGSTDRRATNAGTVSRQKASGANGLRKNNS